MKLVCNIPWKNKDENDKYNMSFIYCVFESVNEEMKDKERTKATTGKNFPLPLHCLIPSTINNFIVFPPNCVQKSYPQRHLKAPMLTTPPPEPD